ncbi:hypothetical protein D3C75_979390 [compost metagenome]
MSLQICQRIADCDGSFGPGDFLLRVKLPVCIQLHNTVVQGALDRTGIIGFDLILVFEFHNHWLDHRQLAADLNCINELMREFFAR